MSLSSLANTCEKPSSSLSLPTKASKSAEEICTDLLVRSRPDPRTTLLVIFICNALVMNRFNFEITLAVAGIALLALATERAWTWIAGFLIFEAALIALMYAPALLWPNTVTALFKVAGGWIFKLTTASSIAAYGIKVISPNELIAALRQWHIPRSITVSLTVLLRFIPMVISEYRAVRNAMALRGLHMGLSAFIHPLRFLEHVLVPLLSSCARLADEMTAAGMVRGLGSTCRPSTINTLRFKAADAIWIAVVIALIIFFHTVATGTGVPGGLL